MFEAWCVFRCFWHDFPQSRIVNDDLTSSLAGTEDWRLHSLFKTNSVCEPAIQVNKVVFWEVQSSGRLRKRRKNKDDMHLCLSWCFCLNFSCYSRVTLERNDFVLSPFNRNFDCVAISKTTRAFRPDRVAAAVLFAVSQTQSTYGEPDGRWSVPSTFLTWS